MDALRNLRRDGAELDAAAALRRCSAARVRSSGSEARRPCGPHVAVSLRSHRRSTDCHDRTMCRRRPKPGNRRRQTLDGSPRRRQIAIGDWTGVRPVRNTAPSRRRGLPMRLLKEARPVFTPSAGLPSCTGLMVAAPCSDHPGGTHPRKPAASSFTAAARNQSHELRSRRENQNQPKPPESGGFTPPPTLPGCRVLVVVRPRRAMRSRPCSWR